MGQKINPLGFRLGTTQSHHSIWFAQPKKYSECLEEDKKIRDCIKKYVQKNIRISSGMEGIARIEIQKRIDLIYILQAEDGIRVFHVTGVQTCALPICKPLVLAAAAVIALVAGGAYFLHRDEGADAGAWRTVEVEQGDIRVAISATGTLSAISTV